MPRMPHRAPPRRQRHRDSRGRRRPARICSAGRRATLLQRGLRSQAPRRQPARTAPASHTLIRATPLELQLSQTARTRPKRCTRSHRRSSSANDAPALSDQTPARMDQPAPRFVIQCHDRPTPLPPQQPFVLLQAALRLVHSNRHLPLFNTCSRPPALLS